MRLGFGFIQMFTFLVAFREMCCKSRQFMRLPIARRHEGYSFKNISFFIEYFRIGKLEKGLSRLKFTNIKTGLFPVTV